LIILDRSWRDALPLGAQANFDLALELFSSMDNIYKLEVLNLPRQISCDFLESQTSARLSQV